MTEQHINLARWPICAESIKVAAYELLFRCDNTKQASIFAGDPATSQASLNAFHEMDMGEVVQSHPGCINFTYQLNFRQRRSTKSVS